MRNLPGSYYVLDRPSCRGLSEHALIVLIALTLVKFEDIEEAAIWWDALQTNPMDKVNMVGVFVAGVYQYERVEC